MEKKPVEKHFRITYIKEVNMLSTTHVPHKEDYALEDIQDVLDRYKDLAAKDNVVSLNLLMVELYAVNPEEL